MRAGEERAEVTAINSLCPGCCKDLAPGSQPSGCHGARASQPAQVLLPANSNAGSSGRVCWSSLVQDPKGRLHTLLLDSTKASVKVLA